MTIATVEDLVRQFGEEHRRLIVDAIRWIDQQEPKWNLDRPIDRSEFIASLVSSAVCPSRARRSIVE